jgi:hypothetical protein
MRRRCASFDSRRSAKTPALRKDAWFCAKTPALRKGEARVRWVIEKKPGALPFEESAKYRRVGDPRLRILDRR